MSSRSALEIGLAHHHKLDRGCADLRVGLGNRKAIEFQRERFEAWRLRLYRRFSLLAAGFDLAADLASAGTAISPITAPAINPRCSWPLPLECAGCSGEVNGRSGLLFPAEPVGQIAIVKVRTISRNQANGATGDTDEHTRDTPRFVDGKIAFAHVATVGSTGAPQVTPVWYDYKDGMIRINTGEGRVKAKNLPEGAPVALSILDPDNAYRYLQVRGHVKRVTRDGADAHIDALSRKYLGKDYPWRNPAETRITIEIEPNTAIRWAEARRLVFPFRPDSDGRAAGDLSGDLQTARDVNANGDGAGFGRRSGAHADRGAIADVPRDADAGARGPRLNIKRIDAKSFTAGSRTRRTRPPRGELRDGGGKLQGLHGAQSTAGFLEEET